MACCLTKRILPCIFDFFIQSSFLSPWVLKNSRDRNGRKLMSQMVTTNCSVDLLLLSLYQHVYSSVCKWNSLFDHHFQVNWGLTNVAKCRGKKKCFLIMTTSLCIFCLLNLCSINALTDISAIRRSIELTVNNYLNLYLNELNSGENLRDFSTFSKLWNIKYSST